MFGFPKVFSTKQDFYNVRDSFLDETKRKLQEVADGRFMWVKERELNDSEEGITDTTHKVITTQKESVSGMDMRNQEMVKVQMMLVEDNNSEFYQMGWTIPEFTEFMSYTLPETDTEVSTETV